MKKIAVAFSVLLFFVQLNLVGQSKWPLNEWNISTPKSEGIIPDSLNMLDKNIAKGKYGNVDEVVITRYGKLIFQKKYSNDYTELHGEKSKKVSGLNPFELGGPFNYFHPWWHPYYHNSELHTLQSATKSVTSAIIGIAVARKEFPDLSTSVLSYFDTTKVKNIDARKRRMTIRHLLTMTGGFEWEEWVSFDDPKNDCAKMEASFDWIQYAIDKPMVSEPGQRFKYSSGGSQLLSYIFRKSTGKDIEEYAAQYLFSPLGIKEWFWKRTPTGLADTEGGLYLKVTDVAKIGYLFLRAGNWNGKQIVTSDWVKASVTPSISLNRSVKYGYKWWLMTYGSDKTKYAWTCRGFGDQSVIIIPEYDIVAVFTCWNIIEGSSFSFTTDEAIRRLVGSILNK
jgi:hypothetical protein